MHRESVDWENVTHLEDPLEGVQVADLTLHNGAQDETSHNLKHDANSAASSSVSCRSLGEAVRQPEAAVGDGI